MLGGEAALHENFANIIHDIALLNSLGVKLVLIHGSRPQIDQRLASAGLQTEFHDGKRITDTAAMEHVSSNSVIPRPPRVTSRKSVASIAWIAAPAVASLAGSSFRGSP